MRERVISPRAKRVWIRLMDWYGTRLGETYGPEPPPDWCAVVDAADNAGVKAGLAVIRREYVNFPPTFPQFAKAMKARDEERDEVRAQHGEAESRAAWDTYLRNDNEEARLKLKLAKCARIEATMHISNPICAEAQEEARAANEALLALWQKRREARKGA